MRRKPQEPGYQPWAAWAQYYDLTVGDHAPFIAFNRDLISATTRSLLDLGCGTGTITIALARHLAERNDGWSGIRIVGVDGSEEMLRVARKRNDRIQWVLGDMRSPPVEAPFDLVISCYNTLQFLVSDDDLAQTLRAVRQVISPDGLFAFDVYQPNLEYLRHPYSNRLARSATDDTGRRFEVREDTSYDSASRILTIDWRLIQATKPEDPPLARTRYHMRQYFPADIDRLLAAEGFVVRERYGDLDRSPFTSQSKKQVVVCGLAEVS